MLGKIISFILIFLITISNFQFVLADEIIPDIILSFQSPSYLTDKDLIQDTYHCDKSKPECKVNFDLSDTFGGYVSTKFACENNFSFITGDENKCNPSTIIFPEGIFLISFKIYEKDIPTNFKEKSITIINEIEQTDAGSGAISNTGSIEENIPEQGTNSGSISETGSIDSGSLDIETNTGTNSESGSIDSGTGNLSQSGSTLIEIPNVDIEIQSGLELINFKYKCKEKDCKVNLNLEKMFTGSFESSNYSCEWKFGSGKFTTIDTDKKCNPGYVNYGTGNFNIEAKISEKNNILNFKTGSLDFSNGIIDYSDDSGSSPEGQSDESFGSGFIDDLNHSETSSEGQYSNSGSIEIPDVAIEIQSGLEFINGKYRCKDTDCKVNLNLENLFTGSYESKNYSCFWNFSSGTYLTLDTDKKCNPGYVTYGSGNFDIFATIFEKNNLTNFKTGSLSFYNEIDPETSSGGQKNTNSSLGGNSYLETIKDIILQSGALKINDGNYLCNEESCSINVKYENSSSESCLWDFTGGNYKEKYIYTCNPGVVYYNSGDYKIGLKINKNGIYLGEKNITLKNNFIDKAKEFNLPPKAKITLQGTVGKNKELIGNTLICRNTKECSVNFDGSESTDANNDNLDFFWDFGNGEFEEKANPKTVKYSTGKYKIKLKVIDRFGEYNEDYFFMEVYENEKEKEIIVLNENIPKYIKIIEAFPNPVGSEENEWIKIKNDSINFINIKGLEIDDKIGKGSKSYIITNDLFLFPYSEKKLYKSETKLNLNNSFDEINLIYNDKIVDTLSWNYEVPEGFTVKKELREKVKVISVIDGDTIVIQFSDGKKEKLRLIGVDTPETKHPIKKVEEFGIVASNFTKDSLNGKEINLELDPSNYRDKYNRLLGFVWIKSDVIANDSEAIQKTGNNVVNGLLHTSQGQNEGYLLFNKLLIEKGYGRAYLYFPFKYSEDFAKAEKEAKKNKLGIWGNDEIKKEMQLLEKLEKNEVLQNKKMIENISLNNIFTNISKIFDKNTYKDVILNNRNLGFLSFSIDKKDLQKENLIEFDLLLKNLIINNKITGKIVKAKQEKILNYKTSKLKSGLKITGVTFPNSMVTISFDEIKLETRSDNIGNYTFLVKDNLKVGEYDLIFLVSNGGQDYNYIAPRTLVLSKNYIFGVQDYMVKQNNKKLKPKKIKKTKKKKLIAKNTTKKMKYDVKDIKKEEDKSSSGKNIIIIFLISLLVSIMGFFVIKKFD